MTGISPHLSYDDYAALPGLRWSVLREIMRSPAHCRYALDGGNGKETEQMTIGKAVAEALFEDGIEEGAIIPYDGRRAGKAWDEFKDEHADKLILPIDDYVRVCNMTAAVKRDADEFIGGDGYNELSIEWTQGVVLPDGSGGAEIGCKARLDRVIPGVLVELKTTADASPAAFRRTVERYRYHWQTGFYLLGLNAVAHPVERRVVFVVVERDPPHAVGVYELDKVDVDAGRSGAINCLTRYAECYRANQWPSYGRNEIALSEYARNQEMTI